MSVALDRRPGARPVAAATTQPADIARFAGWCFAAFILFTAIYFHSRTADPGVRFAIRNGTITNYGPSWWDQQKFGQFTPGDLAVIGFAYIGVIARLSSRRTQLHTRTAWLIGIGIVAVTIGVAVGVLNSTPSPFGDWRYLAIGLLFAFGLWSTILQTERDCFRFAQIFVAIMAVYGVDQLMNYAKGGGEIAFYGRTTSGDHATLEFMVAAVGISMAMLRTRRTRALWMAGIVIGTAVVILAFRRYAWVELATVFAAFIVLSGANRRRYLASIAAVGAVGVITVALTWSALDWGSRLASLDPTQTRAENVYATTNQGHIDDILDGWDQVRANPVTGIGVGVLYHPTRSATWKGEAGMVHNAPIEVWIKFGILGVIIFFATYFVLFRDIWRRRRRGRVSDLLAFGGGAFLLGNFIVICTVYPWAFSTWEKGILIFSLIAMAYPTRLAIHPHHGPGPLTEPKPSDGPTVPDVSVVTPSYGYAHYLRDAIDSVVEQRGITVEHVIQDGGSTDGTVELLRELDDLVDWTSEPDEGQSDALNRGISRARGRWIAWLNADEFYLPDGLAALAREGDRTGADVIYGDTLFSDGDGRLTRLLPQHRFSPFVLRSYGCYISTVSSIVRTSALGSDPIDATMRRMMDWDLYLRLMGEGAAFRYVEAPIGVFRAHDTRVTATERRGFFQRLNRGDGFGREYDMVRDRYGAMRMRRAGHIAHGVLKLTDGAYGRQARGKRVHGVDLRWFQSDGAARDWERVRAACYPAGT